MSTQLELHRLAMEEMAYAAVKQFVAGHRGYNIDADQSGSFSTTNYVIFGARGNDQVVYKVFCEDERKAREIYALNHFRGTGIVPYLLDEDGQRLIVESRIPGGWLPMPNTPAYVTTDPQRAGYTLGRAVAALVAVPLSSKAAHDFESNFYDGLTLDEYLRSILDAARLIYQNITAYHTPLFADSIASIQAHLPDMLAHRRLLYHQDALNMHFVGSDFAGFFDLEMCRVGTRAMQIGSLWNFFATHDNWQAFNKGYATISGQNLNHSDFAAAKAFADFLVWRYISRYGRFRAEPDDDSGRAQAEADALDYARSIEMNNSLSPHN